MTRSTRIETDTAERPHLRTGQRALAEDVTTLVHGAEHTAGVQAASAALFGKGELGSLDAATLGAALHEAPHVSVPAGELPLVVDLLVATELSAEQVSGPAGHRRGWRLRQQRAADRPRMAPRP